jgi:hypothetical protein
MLLLLTLSEVVGCPFRLMCSEKVLEERLDLLKQQ